MNAIPDIPIAPQPNAKDASLTAVGRVIGDLRRGMAIVLRDGNTAILVTAAESSVDPRALTLLTDTNVSCLVTAARAEALGLDPVDASVVAIDADGGLDRDAVATVIGEATDGAALQGLFVKAADRLQQTAVEVVKLARLLPAALTAPIEENATAFAQKHNLLALDIANLNHYRGAAGELMDYTVTGSVPLEGAEETKLVAFRPADGGKEHLAIIIGDPDPESEILARLHSECFTGDLLGSLRCDCGDQLRGAVEAIAKAGGGVLLYLAQEGRGIGLVNKLRAYRLQDDGFDTIDANEQLGFDADERVYAPAASMLKRLGYNRIRLMTNNPLKVSALKSHGIEIADRVPHAFPANGHNEQYLQTKAARAGHLF
jgi:GTP cyclohydrolase II